MPSSLSDVNTFTDPIAVPIDGEDQTAASIRTPFQGLSNRTRHLKNRADGHDSSLAALDTRIDTLELVPARVSALEAVRASHSYEVMLPITSFDYVDGHMSVAESNRKTALLIANQALAVWQGQLPVGHTVTKARVYVLPSAGATAEVRLRRVGWGGDPKLGTESGSDADSLSSEGTVDTDLGQTMAGIDLVELEIKQVGTGAVRIYWAKLYVTTRAFYYGDL
jgi:hypothetical protein